MPAQTAANSTIAAVIKLLGDGEMTFAEAGRLAGQQRQTIYHWAKARGISANAVNKARELRLRRIWAQTLAEQEFSNETQA